jgi:hypothetical protein
MADKATPRTTTETAAHRDKLRQILSEAKKLVEKNKSLHRKIKRNTDKLYENTERLIDASAEEQLTMFKEKRKMYQVRKKPGVEKNFALENDDMYFTEREFAEDAIRHAEGEGFF